MLRPHGVLGQLSLIALKSQSPLSGKGDRGIVPLCKLQGYSHCLVLLLFQFLFFFLLFLFFFLIVFQRKSLWSLSYRR